MFLGQTYSALQPSAGDRTDQILVTISRQLAGIDQTVAVIPPFTPQDKDVLVNSLFFSSLFCSLIASGMSLWVKEWLREINLDTPHLPRKLARVREFRHQAIHRWCIRYIIATIAFILQLSTMLFCVALLRLVWTINPALRIVLSMLVGLWVAATLFTAICPTFSPQCPYKSSFARGIFQVGWFLKRPQYGSFYEREWKVVDDDARCARLEIEALEHLNEEFIGDPRLEIANQCYADFAKSGVNGVAESIERIIARRLDCDRKRLAKEDFWKKLPIGYLLKDKVLLHLMEIWCRFSDGDRDMQSILFGILEETKKTASLAMDRSVSGVPQDVVQIKSSVTHQ